MLKTAYFFILQEYKEVIRPKTRRSVEQAARTQAASIPNTSPTPASMEKKAVTKQITDRARKKAQREAQRGILQRSKQAAQATADLSKRAAQATTKAVKELIGALSAIVGGATLAALQTGDYSSIDIQGSAPDWREVAVVFACKTAMGANSVDVAALTSDRVERLRAVFWDMCALSSDIETIIHEATDDSEAWTEGDI